LIHLKVLHYITNSLLLFIYFVLGPFHRIIFAAKSVFVGESKRQSLTTTTTLATAATSTATAATANR
jgi:hypothetical protein